MRVNSEAKYNFTVIGEQLFISSRPKIIYTIPSPSRRSLEESNPLLKFVYLRPLESPFDFVNEIFLEKTEITGFLGVL